MVFKSPRNKEAITFKSDLDKLIKRHFYDELIVCNDVTDVLKKYKSLSVALDRIGGEVVLNLKGTLPYTHANVEYHCPIGITIGTLYPKTPPLFKVISSGTIRIATNHPCVAKNGNIVMAYFDKWSARCTVMDAINLVLGEFNKQSPIYQVGQLEQVITLTEVVSPRLTISSEKKINECIPDWMPDSGLSLDSTYNDIHDGIKDAHKNIKRSIVESKPQLLVDYDCDITKYDLHKCIMEEWVPLCADIGLALKRQYSDKLYLSSQIRQMNYHTTILDDVADYFGRVNKLASQIKQLEVDVDATSGKEDIYSESLESFYNQVVITDKDPRIKAITAELSADSMIELVNTTFKRKRISTKDYIQYIRRLSTERFIAMYQRRQLSAA
ncbi:UEV domain family protein [Babesia bovis T2Bo]|uniref:UEV domain-containing protein n=1 Tax=Babesia bovis TaxID=5865 RepID=A7ASA6_BABBO|nr:UEV domain family protein [Babesia bovis T2Bo]EDO07425.1 UEV domain family protein [Babesia bovis T2Bo]BAN64366.1 hypothetical protein [Babesia bovis]|eukprot:XP_001610993.1 hypothetical protein [Babesia bovis T2Bo]